MTALLAAELRIPPQKAERRRHQRVPIALVGRYMLSDRQEYPCETVDVSPGGALLVASVRGQIGEKVIAYLEHLGRVEGEIARHTPGGFAIQFSVAFRKRDKIASQLTWLVNRQSLGLPEDRRHERIVPHSVGVILRLESGREIAARIIDVSLSGVGLAVEPRPAIGTNLTVGSTKAKVIRHFQNGVAVEFPLALSPDRFDENLVL